MICSNGRRLNIINNDATIIDVKDMLEHNVQHDPLVGEWYFHYKSNGVYLYHTGLISFHIYRKNVLFKKHVYIQAVKTIFPKDSRYNAYFDTSFTLDFMDSKTLKDWYAIYLHYRNDEKIACSSLYINISPLCSYLDNNCKKICFKR